MATPLALWATGVLSLQTVLSGFGDPAVIFIAALFVVSAGLEQSGVTAWAGQLLIAQAGEDSRTRLLLLTMVSRGIAHSPHQRQWRGRRAAAGRRGDRGPPETGAIATADAARFRRACGFAVALTGSPVNVLVSNAAVEAGLRRFSFFEFALVGIPLLAGTMAIIILFGRATAAREQRSLAAFRLQQARTDTDRAVWAQQWPVPHARQRDVTARGAGDGQTRS